MADMLGGENERKIFAGVFKRDEDVFARRNLLRNTIGIVNAYKNEFQVFYVMLDEKPTLMYDKEYLRMLLTYHRGKFLHNSNIDLNAFAIGDQDPYDAFVESCINLFSECEKEEVSNEVYELSIEKFKLMYITQESLNILDDSAEILGDGKTVRGHTRQGYEDMRSYMSDKFLKLDNMRTGTQRRGTIVYGVNDTDEDKSLARKKICDWGIPSLDAVGGIMEGSMISVLAPPKNGKSRFAYSIIEEAITQGVNCLVWSKENGAEGAEAIIRAKNFNRNFNTGVTPEKRKFLDDNAIAQDKYETPEYRELELANWFKFKHREDYGRLANVDQDLCIENFIDIIDEDVTKYNIKLICVDYLQIIDEQNKTGIAKNELVGRAYTKLLQYIKNKKIAGIFPAQIKQDVLSTLEKSKDLGSVDLRTAGAESSEVIRTPDVNLLIYASPTELKMGKMTLIPLPSRNMPLIDPLNMQIDLGSASFVEVQNNL